MHWSSLCALYRTPEIPGEAKIHADILHGDETSPVCASCILGIIKNVYDSNGYRHAGHTGFDSRRVLGG